MNGNDQIMLGIKNSDMNIWGVFGAVINMGGICDNVYGKNVTKVFEKIQTGGRVNSGYTRDGRCIAAYYLEKQSSLFLLIWKDK